MYTYWDNLTNIDLNKFIAKQETTLELGAFSPIDARDAQIAFKERGEIASKEDLLILCRSFLDRLNELVPAESYADSMIYTVIDWAYSLSDVGNETTPDRKVVSCMKPKLVINKDCRWFQKNYMDLKKEYLNHWVAIADQKVIGNGKSFMDALKIARDNGYKRPFITKVSPDGWENKING